jgi:hypothetical protein
MVALPDIADVSVSLLVVGAHHARARREPGGRQTADVCVEEITDDRGRSLEEKVARDYGAGNIVDAGVVISGVLAEYLERVIDSGLSLGSEHAFGLLDNEPGVQRLLQLFGGALFLPCGRSVREVASRDAGEDRGDSQILG